MDFMHNTIGIVGVVALVVIVSHAASQVVVHTSDPFGKAVNCGTNAVDRLAPGEAGIPVIECDRLHGTCSMVRNVGHRVYVVLEIFSRSGNNTTETATNQKSNVSKKRNSTNSEKQAENAMEPETIRKSNESKKSASPRASTQSEAM